MIKPTLVKPVPDADDLASLWTDDADLGDAITSSAILSIGVGKPKAFFRTVRDPSYRRRAWLYTHTPEGVVDEQHFIIDRPMLPHLAEEAHPGVLVTTIYRDGTLRIWPIRLPKDGRDNV